MMITTTNMRKIAPVIAIATAAKIFMAAITVMKIMAADMKAETDIRAGTEISVTALAADMPEDVTMIIGPQIISGTKQKKSGNRRFFFLYYHGLS
jgi:hypothetical protein